MALLPPGASRETDVRAWHGGRVTPLPLSPGADLDGLDLADVDLSGADGHDARVLECTFTACRLDGVRLDGARLVDTTWSRVRADELSLARTTWWDGTLTEVAWVNGPQEVCVALPTSRRGWLRPPG